MVLEQGGVGAAQVLRALWTAAQRILEEFITIPLASPPEGTWLGFCHLLLGYETFKCQIKKQIPAWNKNLLCYQSSKKQPPTNRRIGSDCLHHIPNTEAVRGPTASWTNLEETVMS